MNFLSPLTTSDGKPYGPILYKRLVKEAFYITKNTSTSYTEVLDMNPSERKLILDFLVEEANKEKEAMEKAMAKTRGKNYKNSN